MEAWIEGLAEAVQFLFNVLAIALNLFFVGMMRTEYFHRNMRIILTLNALSLAVAQTAALFSDNIIDHLPVGLPAAKSVVDVVRDAALNVNTFMIAPLMGERVAASVGSPNYERKGRASYMSCAIFFVASSWILNLVAACSTEDILMNFDLSAETVKLKSEAEHNKYWLAVYYATGGLVNILSFLIFLVLYKYNQRRYEGGINHSRHSLSMRYQLAENVRTGRQLMPVALLTSVAQTFYGYILTNAVWSNLSSRFMELILVVFPPLCALTAFLTPFVLILFHDGMRRAFLGATRMRRAPVNHVEGLNGQRLILKKEETAEVYFAMLTKSWV